MENIETKEVLQCCENESENCENDSKDCAENCMDEDKKVLTTEEILEEERNSVIEALEKSYKGGYLDGMIVGLHASGVCTDEEISGYLNAEIDYVKAEIDYFSQKCAENGVKMPEFLHKN